MRLETTNARRGEHELFEPSLARASHVLCLADVTWRLRRISIRVQRVGEVRVLAIHHNALLLNVNPLQLQDESSPRYTTYHQAGGAVVGVREPGK